jgi:hypothetical protein
MGGWMDGWTDVRTVERARSVGQESSHPSRTLHRREAKGKKAASADDRDLRREFWGKRLSGLDQVRGRVDLQLRLRAAFAGYVCGCVCGLVVGLRGNHVGRPGLCR